MTGGKHPGPSEAFFAAWASAACLLGLYLIAGPLLGRIGVAQLAPASWLALNAALAQCALLIPVVVVVVAARLPLPTGLGLRRPRLLPTGLAVMSMVGGGIVLDELMHFLVWLWPKMRSPGLDEMGSAIGDVGLWGALALLFPLALLPGFVEEFLCRGLLLRGFARGFPAWAALLMSATFFGVLHFDRLHSPTAFLMGLLLGAFVLRTGTVWTAIICHVLNNSVAICAPSLGSPPLPAIIDEGHSALVLGCGVVAFVFGLVGLIWATSKDDKGHKEKGCAQNGEEHRAEQSPC